MVPASAGSDGSTVGHRLEQDAAAAVGGRLGGHDAGDARVAAQDARGRVGLVRVHDDLQGARAPGAECLLDLVVPDPRGVVRRAAP